MNSFKNLGKANIILLISTFVICVLIIGTTVFVINQNNSQVSNANSTSSSSFTSSNISSSQESSSSSSSSTSSIASSTSISSSISSVVSSSAVSITPVQPIKKQLNYKNPFFENYNIVYPEDWKFSTVTSESFANNLINRQVILEKNGVKLIFSTGPAAGKGCVGLPTDEEDENQRIYERVNLGNIQRRMFGGYDEFKLTYTFISSPVTCNLTQELVSNLNVADFKEYKNIGYTSANGKMYFSFYINTVNLENSNTTMIQEVDNIIKNSSFEKQRK